MSETAVISGSSLRAERLDVWSEQRISDLGTEDAFRKFCEVECGWGRHEIHTHEDMLNALREFVRQNPGVYKHVRTEN